MVIREEPRLQIISDELWQRVKARQSAQSIGPHGMNLSKAGKPATTLLSGLLLCEDCGSRFIASDQYSYQCATRAYGGLSACSNKVRVKRARAEAAIVDYIAEELLSPEAVDIAKRAYQEAIRKELGTREHAKVKGAGTLHAEEAQLREMLRAGTLSPDVARAALDAVERKRRTIATALRMPAARSAEAFSLGLERYRDAVRNLGKHVPYSDQAAEERRLVRELLGGHGTVFTRDGRIGARFRSAGLLDMEEFSYKSKIYNCGSGGRI